MNKTKKINYAGHDESHVGNSMSETTLSRKAMKAARGSGFVIPSASWDPDCLQIRENSLFPPAQWSLRKWCAMPMCLVNLEAA